MEDPVASPLREDEELDESNDSGSEESEYLGSPPPQIPQPPSRLFSPRNARFIGLIRAINNENSAECNTNGRVNSGQQPKPEESDDSDVEDPKYLKEMCSGFTSKIKEKSDIISIYKKVLFNTQLQLVKMEASHQRKLRKILVYDRIRKGQLIQPGVVVFEGGANRIGVNFNNGTNGREHERDALSIFPEEIWLMVLDNVTDVKDLRSCSKVCQLFSRILEASKTQWLFGKVFPMIFNNLRRKEVLNCRTVSKQWCLGVDKFLEDYHTIPPEKTGELEKMEENLESPSVPLKSFHFEYTFSIPAPRPEDLDSSSNSEEQDEESLTSSQDSINRSHDKVRQIMKLHPKNPFIGRSVTLEEDSADFDQVQDQAGNRTFVTEAKLFLQDFGRHIWHLSICCNLDIQTPTNFYEVCLQSLVECANLKSLCLSGGLNFRFMRRLSEHMNILNQHPAPPDNAHLESMQIDVNSTKICMIQDKLIEKYSNQLKRLEVQVWNSQLYPDFQWSLLRELQINKASADVVLESLKKMKLPSLRRLAIRLHGKGPYLKTILELTNRFQKLNHLEIKFESRFGGMSEDELVKLPPGLTSCSNLTILELTSSLTDILSYNFLMYFPYLQRLLIRHGHWTSSSMIGSGSNAPYFTHLQRASFKVIKKTEIVKIAKYIMQENVNTDIKAIYKSNIWGMLPFLQILELRNARYVPEKRRTFTRGGYEHYHKSTTE